MTNIGRHVRTAHYSGIVIAERTVRKTLKFTVKLDKAHPVTGETAIFDAKAVEFTDEPLLGYASYDARYEAELTRAGGDATLLRRR